jgi:hypothetical protein
MDNYTSLKLPTNNKAYRNAREYWTIENDEAMNLSGYISGYHSEDMVLLFKSEVICQFILWLQSQGATIIHNKPPNNYSSDSYHNNLDSYSVAIGIDELEFDTEENLILFILRWLY